MDELTNMGFTKELASQALAATGGKSIVKATEWILSQCRTENATGPLALRQPQQAKVDKYFTAPRSPLNEDQLPVPEEHDAVQVGRYAGDAYAPLKTSKGLKGTKEEIGSNVSPAGQKRPTPGKSPQREKTCYVNGSGQAGKGLGASNAYPRVGQVWPEGPSKKAKQDNSEQHLKSFPFFQPQGWQSNKGSTSGAKSTTPLAERMRPATIDEVIGQDHLLGPKGIVHTLLQSGTMASIIFWGPPGTGKTSIVRAMARSISYRFVALSAVTSGIKEVKDILEEAKRTKKYGQQTLLFLDEVHRFNKAQQDVFLPYVEAGHIVFIGATTENPSFQINAALRSRCRVLVVNKLQPEHLEKLLHRAVVDEERGVLASIGSHSNLVLNIEEDAVKFLAAAADGDARVALNALEIAVLTTFSRYQSPAADTNIHASIDAADDERHDLCQKDVQAERLVPGNVGTKRDACLSILEMLKENVYQTQEEYTKPFKKFVGGKEVIAQGTMKRREGLIANSEADKDCNIKEGVNSEPMHREGLNHAVSLDTIESTSVTPSNGTQLETEPILVVTLDDVKDALQRSHVLYDKTGEEHYNLISALHKSMRGGDADAAIYWLARMLEGGEEPLYIARRLIRFASEDVGLADPLALTQAVACYQACHFLGMPECNVHLAQCVVYLSFTPKSIAVYEAIKSAQQLVKEGGQNEPVPLHLRNAPTKLMKELGYGEGYIYPPGASGHVDQDYMPASLRGRKFL